jgi:hypothetical protein
MGTETSLPVAREVLVDFLVQAGRNMYAALGDAATVTPILPGSHQLEYRKDDLSCRDIYFGSMYFVGQTTVYHEGLPIWAMGYAGGIIEGTVAPEEVGEVYGFLREALRCIAPEHPYRGPSEFRRDPYGYIDENSGEVERFWGAEVITRCGNLVYQLRYAGGLLR